MFAVPRDLAYASLTVFPNPSTCINNYLYFLPRAKLALMECHQLLGPKITNKKLNIWFHGLGHFNNQVMFAKIKDVDGIIDTLYGLAGKKQLWFFILTVSLPEVCEWHEHLCALQWVFVPGKKVQTIKLSWFKNPCDDWRKKILLDIKFWQLRQGNY